MSKMYKLVRKEGVQKLQVGAKTGAIAMADPAPRNRNPITLTVVKGIDKKTGQRYTETTHNQEDDMYPGRSSYVPPAHKSNAWFNSLTPAQKEAHNKAVRKKEDKLRQAAVTPETPVPGMRKVEKVYEPSAPAVANTKRYWTKEDVVAPFGGNTVWGTTTDMEKMDRARAKNAIDKTSITGSRNKYVTREFTPKEIAAWEAGIIGNESSPINLTPQDSIRRSNNIDIKLDKFNSYHAKKQAAMNSRNQNNKSQSPLYTTESATVARKKGGPMVNGKELKTPPALIKRKQPSSNAAKDGDCNCGGDKMEKGGTTIARQGGGPVGLKQEQMKQAVAGAAYGAVKQRRALTNAVYKAPVGRNTPKTKPFNTSDVKKDDDKVFNTSDYLEQDRTTKYATKAKEGGLLYKCGGKNKGKMKAKK